MKELFGKYILLIVLIIFLSSCSSSNSKVEDDKFVNNIKPLAPGTAQICGTIKEVKETSDFLLVLVHVDTVFNYGQSTPPLVAGKNLEANIAKDLIADSFHINELSDSQKMIYLELKHQKILSLENKEKSKWSVSKMALNKIFK